MTAFDSQTIWQTMIKIQTPVLHLPTLTVGVPSRYFSGEETDRCNDVADPVIAFREGHSFVAKNLSDFLPFTGPLREASIGLQLVLTDVIEKTKLAFFSSVGDVKNPSQTTLYFWKLALAITLREQQTLIEAQPAKEDWV